QGLSRWATEVMAGDRWTVKGAPPGRRRGTTRGRSCSVDYRPRGTRRARPTHDRHTASGRGGDMKALCTSVWSLLRVTVLASLGGVSVCRAADLTNLPPNTWVEIKYTTAQPSDSPDEKGSFRPVGWNKVVYDPDSKRVLFYDRWVDKKHGGLTIYGNCLFAFDPASAKLTPVKIDNWKKIDTTTGGYRTVPLPENDKARNPATRHVY